MNGVVASGCGDLILHYLGGPRLCDALKDISALLSTCRSWAECGDDAWHLFRTLYESLLPSPARLGLVQLSPSKLVANGSGNGSARVTFFEEMWRYSKLLRTFGPRRGVSVVDFNDHLDLNYRDDDTGIVLFGKEIEFFAALRVINEAWNRLVRTITTSATSKMILVIVGPSFKGVDLSSPKLVGRFLILSHERIMDVNNDGGRSGDSVGLLAIHPSALSEDEQVASSVLAYSTSTRKVVIGIDPRLGRILAGVPDVSQAGIMSVAPAWRERVLVHWGRRHVVPNGPYHVFRSFCDSMYPYSFLAPASGGFYNAAHVNAMEALLCRLVGSAMLSIQEGDGMEQGQPSLSEHKEVSFVKLYFSGVLSLESVVVPLY